MDPNNPFQLTEEEWDLLAGLVNAVADGKQVKQEAMGLLARLEERVKRCVLCDVPMTPVEAEQVANIVRQWAEVASDAEMEAFGDATSRFKISTSPHGPASGLSCWTWASD